MKVEVTSKSGICFKVEFTEEEKQAIKEDLEKHLSEMKDLTNSGNTDIFLSEIRNIL